MPDTVGSDQHKPTSLRGIANKAKSDKRHRFRDLYGCLDAELLLDCWHDLNKSAASGVDGVTAAAYEEDLQANIQALAERLKSKRYRAKLVRRKYIPKENGKERPGASGSRRQACSVGLCEAVRGDLRRGFLELQLRLSPGTECVRGDP